MKASEFDGFMTTFAGSVVCLIGLGLMVVPPVGIVVLLLGLGMVFSGFSKK